MLQTLPLRDNTWVRAGGIAVFALLTAVASRVTIEIGTPVPFTLQVLTILLAGLVLGSRDGAASQLAYLGLIAINLPVDARALGVAAFAGPTAGFLVGFPVMAFVAGALAERGGEKLWVRWVAGLVGVAVLYVFGATWLKVVTGMTWGATISAAVAPFVALDMVKAIIAAALAEGGRAMLARAGMTYSDTAKPR
ncbi:MAG: biotin transporter BioY [Chloroflexota bacterium]